MVVVFDWKYLQFADIFIEIQLKTYDMLLYLHTCNQRWNHSSIYQSSIYLTIRPNVLWNLTKTAITKVHQSFLLFEKKHVIYD